MHLVTYPVDIPPAGDGSVDAKAARVTIAHVDGRKRSLWQWCVTDVVVPPTGDRPVRAKSATVLVPELYLFEGSRKRLSLIRVVLVAPANHRPIGAQAAGVIFGKLQLGKGIG